MALAWAKTFLHPGLTCAWFFFRHWMIFPSPGFTVEQNFSTSPLHASITIWTLAFTTSLQASETWSCLPSRQLRIAPCPAFTPGQSFFTSA